LNNWGWGWGEWGPWGIIIGIILLAGSVLIMISCG
jgi:hypothetical protein